MLPPPAPVRGVACVDWDALAILAVVEHLLWTYVLLTDRSLKTRIRWFWIVGLNRTLRYHARMVIRFGDLDARACECDDWFACWFENNSLDRGNNKLHARICTMNDEPTQHRRLDPQHRICGGGLPSYPVAQPIVSATPGS